MEVEGSEVAGEGVGGEGPARGELDGVRAGGGHGEVGPEVDGVVEVDGAVGGGVGFPVVGGEVGEEDFHCGILGVGVCGGRGLVVCVLCGYRDCGMGRGSHGGNGMTGGVGDGDCLDELSLLLVNDASGL